VCQIEPALELVELEGVPAVLLGEDGDDLLAALAQGDQRGGGGAVTGGGNTVRLGRLTLTTPSRCASNIPRYPRRRAVLVELHCHSTCSDGSAAPAEVGRRAAERAPAVFALTDHDTCAGHAAIVEHVPAALRAVELTCHDEGRSVHVLVYDAAADARWSELEALLATQIAARRERLRAIGARLFRLGIVLDVEPILAAATADHGRVVGRPDVANALVAQGVASSRDDAFSRWLYDGGPADVPLAKLGNADGLAVVRAVGARAARAHPHQHGDSAGTILKRVAKEGRDGVEAV
jgi:predicted metal-dependent phosphoesterase TrpH